MAILTHGTTLDGFKAIMAGNGKVDLPAPWTVSDNDGFMYFYDAESVAEEFGRDEDDCRVSDAVNSSFENAQLQQALKAIGGKLVVLVCDVPDDIIEEDYSCEGMHHARCIPCGDFDPSWIKQIYTSELDTWTIPGVLACVMSNDLFNTSAIPEKLVKLAQAVGFDDDVYGYVSEAQNVSEFIAEYA